jgi:hypothetical protein
MSLNRPCPVRAILCRYQQHHLSHASALSLLLSIGVLPADARYYLQAGDYEYSWEVA